VYPGNSFFDPTEVLAVARSVGMDCKWIKEIREYFVAISAHDYHDWIVCKPTM
jgi:hypothetical protein